VGVTAAVGKTDLFSGLEKILEREDCAEGV
jgi:hypothetical protein